MAQDVGPVTVYISIGNSDGRLAQREWSAYYALVNTEVIRHAHTLHGRWVPDATGPWQNACWCVELTDAQAEGLRDRLREAAGRFRQESVAWARVPVTEFLTAR